METTEISEKSLRLLMPSPHKRPKPARPAPRPGDQLALSLWAPRPLVKEKSKGRSSWLRRFHESTSSDTKLVLGLPSVRPLDLEYGQAVVYIVQVGGSGPLKVGTSTGKDLESRLSNLQVGNPDRLILRFLLDGGPKDEAHIHESLQRWHIRGEWFSPEALDVLGASEMAAPAEQRLRGEKWSSVFKEGWHEAIAAVAAEISSTEGSDELSSFIGSYLEQDELGEAVHDWLENRLVVPSGPEYGLLRVVA